MTQDPFYEQQSPDTYAPPPAPKKNNTVLIIVIVAAVLLLCCCCVAAGWFLWNNGDAILYELGINLLTLLTH